MFRKKIIIVIVTFSILLGIGFLLGRLSVKEDNSERVRELPGNVLGEETQKEALSFAVLGDTQRFDIDSNGSLQRASKSINAHQVDLVMTVGDLIGSCDEKKECTKKYDKWKKALGPIKDKTFPVMGNHDRTGNKIADEVWQKEFNVPQNGPEGYEESVYSFDRGNAHFVVLNSEKPRSYEIDKTQREWLEKDLSQNRQEHIFVFYHEPAFPVSTKIDSGLDREPKNRDALWEIFKKHKVAAVFNGHEHIHSRKQVDGVYQLVFGNTDSYDHEKPKKGMVEYYYQGRNFGLVEIEGSRVVVKVFDTDGVLLDAKEIKS